MSHPSEKWILREVDGLERGMDSHEANKKKHALERFTKNAPVTEKHFKRKTSPPCECDSMQRQPAVW